MTRRRLVALLAATVVLAPLSGCTGDGGGEEPGRSTRLVPLWEAERPQVIDTDSVLHACIDEAESDETDGTDSVATRVASVVLPVDYRVDPFPRDLPAPTLEGNDYEDYVPTCGFIVGRGIDSERKRGRDVFSVTLPARQSLGAALPHLAPKGAPQNVEKKVPVFAGRVGERAAYRLREPGFGTYDVVAEQADGVRLTWLAPVGRTPSESRAGRRLWRDVRASLAVRSPAASDGDPDASSDDAAPEAPTYEGESFEPSNTGSPPAGYRVATCPEGSATITYWVPERLTSGRTCAFSRPRPLAQELERIHVTADVDAPLREVYEQELTFEYDAGDDSTSDLEYDNDVAGPGGLRGESLVYTAYNDGSPTETHIVQAGGVRLSWSVLPGGWGPQATELAMLLDSMRVRR